MIDRRRFLQSSLTQGIAAATLASAGFGQRTTRSDHLARGSKLAVTSTSREATEAAMGILEEGGNAADAYMAAAITQTISEPGLTSLGGGFGVRFFDASRKETSAIIGRLGPAADEPYDFDRNSPVTQTGRAMPVPGFLAGVAEAHARLGSVPWDRLFASAIGHAENGVVINPKILRAAGLRGVKYDEGKRIWMPEGRMLAAGETLFQRDAARVLRAVAEGGAAAFYEGEFAQHYVDRARADGGKVTLKDLVGWQQLATRRLQTPVGNYRGHQVISGGLITYALHLTEALDLRGSGRPADPESVYRQMRIMEEVFLATGNQRSDEQPPYTDPSYAKQRADFVLNSDPRPLTIDAIFNTCFLVVKDQQGNVAWGTHSINTPTTFGAGIVVDGIYASHAIHRNHVHGAGASAPGISTSFALFRDGVPSLVVGSPGFGFVHGPISSARA